MNTTQKDTRHGTAGTNGAEALGTIQSICLAVAQKPMEYTPDSSHPAPEPILLIVVRNDENSENACHQLEETIQSSAVYRRMKWDISELDVEHLLAYCRGYAADPRARFVARDTIAEQGFWMVAD